MSPKAVTERAARIHPLYYLSLAVAVLAFVVGPLFVNHLSENRGKQRVRELTAACWRGDLLRGLNIIDAQADHDWVELHHLLALVPVLDCEATIAGHSQREVRLSADQNRVYLNMVRHDRRPLVHHGMVIGQLPGPAGI